MSSSSSSGGSGYGPINNITPGYTYVAVVRCGDNVVAGNPWEFCVGADTQTHCSTGGEVWDSNLADGFDSNWVTVILTVSSSDSGSLGTLTVGNNGTSYAQGAFSEISKVQLQASAIGVNGASETRNISAEFSRADGTSETVDVAPSSSPDANNSTGSGQVAQAIEIVPSSDNFKSVSVSMQIRFSSPGTSLPAANALGVGIYVFTA